MLNLQYNCYQPVFYLGSALTSLSAITVHLAKLQKNGKITAANMLIMLVIYALVIYAISRLINWCCVNNYENVAWVIALLPIIGVLATAFE
jgi:hypothetical protein